MKRYHRKIYIPKQDEEILSGLVDTLNTKDWKYSKHCLQRLNEQYISTIEIKNMLEYIKGIKLNFIDIFEYYKESNLITKICFRIKYSEHNDIILVVSSSKTLITIYSNKADDNHITLKKELYNTV